jgi:UDP-N-acetylglucosamine diphosphorylase / glucose-1-phosphate thymidylyltransferase / UDP-N-acetylgalactosamine diphosphorylase / glucosamine-1-phosphate N-acetyltransferase / galactosamine-1-phosphate N-acetyltransferase
MDFVCLAAGAGTRMGRLGTYLQKCMLPVGLRPFLEHTLLQLQATGLLGRDDRLALVVGHHGEQLRRYFGDEFDGAPIVYIDQAERLGTGDALALAAAALEPETPLIAWQADLFVTAAMFRALASHPAPNVVTLGHGDVRESPRLRATLAGDRVARVWDGDSDWLDIGAWKLAPALLAGMRRVRAEKGEYRMLPNLQLALDEGAWVGFVTSDAWIHLGGEFPTPEANVREVLQRVWTASDALERS